MCMDKELIKAARSGDDEALQKLVVRYMDFALEKAKGFVPCSIEYDDIVQEAMLAFLSAYYTYDTENRASFRTYVSVCMNNRIASALSSLDRKKRIPREAIVGLDDIAYDYADDSEDPEKVFFRRQKAEEIVRRAKNELSDKEQKVLSLFLSGMKYEEIAQTVSSTPKSVDSTLQRIRKKLRRAD